MKDEPKFSASGIVNALEHSLHDADPMVREVSTLFYSHLQIILDEFEKVASGNADGKAGFAQRYLLAQTINDLLAGFHLIRQGYTKQSYAVLRSTMEAADMIKLLGKDPTQADHWYAGGKQAYDELSPSKVRRKLGQAKNNPMEQFYHMISELGTHPGFMGSKSHTAKNVKTKELTIWVGGKIFQHSFLFASLYCYVAVLQLWTSFDVIYRDKMTPGDYSRVARQLAANLKKFTGMYPDFFSQSFNGKSFGDLADELVSLLSSVDGS